MNFLLVIIVVTGSGRPTGPGVYCAVNNDFYFCWKLLLLHYQLLRRNIYSL